jgi:ATP-dependent Clp protease ATP-binding subunit ClpA
VGPRLSADVRQVILTAAAGEAGRRGDQRIGTDHLLLGILHDATSDAAMAIGVDLASARAVDEGLDRAALAALGFDFRPYSFAEGRTRPRRLAPLSSGARAVLKEAIDEARTTRSGRLETRHLLLALLACTPPDPAAALIEQLGVDRAIVRDRLAATGSRVS